MGCSASPLCVCVCVLSFRSALALALARLLNIIHLSLAFALYLLQACIQDVNIPAKAMHTE